VFLTGIIQYTNDLSNFDIQKIPLEQQICLLKVTDSVKEKAMQKLKEIKSKSEDSGSKARQYLDGLLKIPFGVYKENDILSFKENFINKIKSLDTNVSLFSDNQIDKYINSLPNTTDTNQQLATEWNKYKVKPLNIKDYKILFKGLLKFNIKKF
jgi:hypothetical protein